MVEIAFAPKDAKHEVKVFLCPEGKKVNVEGGFADVYQSALKQSGFSGKKQTFCRVYTDKGQTIFVGAGKIKTDFEAQELGGYLYKLLKDEEQAAVFSGDEGNTLLNIAFGIEIASYRFDKYFTQKKADELPKLEKVSFIAEDAKQLAQEYKKLAALANGVRFARDLCNEPANVLNPESFAKEAERLSYLGLDVDVLNLKDLRKLGMNMLLSVAQGSVNEPKVVILKWKGKPKQKEFDTALVGKGVTFDSGGISLKPGNGMWDMKGDMTGAAVMVSVMKTAALQKLPQNVIAAVGLVENMPSGSATRPGDIVTSMSGQTVEILNTDAEGRLVLGDVLWYVQEKYKVKTVIDAATLTGATMRALGNQYAGIFGNDEKLIKALIHAGNESGERLWQLPINDEYNKWMDSDVADMKNLSSSANAGGSTAACFLQRFIQKDVKWAHLYIAGVDKEEKGSLLVPKVAKGFGVRLLTDYLNALK